MKINNCENCGKKTTVRELWGIVICRKCTKLYNELSNLAMRELIKRHKKEFEKIRNNKIKEVFKDE